MVPQLQEETETETVVTAADAPRLLPSSTVPRATVTEMVDAHLSNTEPQPQEATETDAQASRMEPRPQEATEMDAQASHMEPQELVLHRPNMALPQPDLRRPNTALPQPDPRRPNMALPQLDPHRPNMALLPPVLRRLHPSNTVPLATEMAAHLLRLRSTVPRAAETATRSLPSPPAASRPTAEAAAAPDTARADPTEDPRSRPPSPSHTPRAEATTTKQTPPDNESPPHRPLLRTINGNPRTASHAPRTNMCLKPCMI